MILQFVLILAVINLLALLVFVTRRSFGLERDVERLQEYRIGLAFIAAGHTFPNDCNFAGALIHGDDATLRRKFHAYLEFRAAELERLENEDA